jgi:zinc transporter ZupT
MSDSSTVTEKRPSRLPALPLGLAPLVVLALVIVAFLALDPLKSIRPEVPPVEELTVTRAVLDADPRSIELSVTNGGPDPVTIAQVLVDDAYWQFEMEPAKLLDRLDRGTIKIPYPWIEGEPHHIVLISSSGVLFEHEVAVATETPKGTARSLWAFTLIGLFVGVIPVLLGLLWLPFLRRLTQRWVDFFLALTAGLLTFLAVDAVDEALEVTAAVPGAFQGVGLLAVGVIVALAALYATDAWMRKRRGEPTPFYIAGLIAIGIGLHNLGEGLAIGAAFSLGEVGFTTFLILGFMIHNITEGLGIVAPLARTRPSIRGLIGLGLLAGIPTILGAWSGGLAYSPSFVVLFLGIGVGAIVQVVLEIGKMLRRGSKAATAPLNAIGFVVGVLVMYVTGLFVAA